MLILVLGLGVAACAATPQHPISVAVVTDGEPAAIDRNAVAGLDLVPIELPAPPPRPPDDASPVLGRARVAYAHGDFTACRDELAKLPVEHLLAIGDRSLAARALTFDAACAWGALARADAKLAAAKLASLGLELPDAAVSPDAEAMIGDAIAQLGKQPRHPLAIDGAAGARLAIDGRPAGCAVPCTVDLPPGDHVIAVDADRFVPEVRTVRTPDVAHVAIAQQPASRELAAQQWRARVGRGLPAIDPVGVELLARLASESRVLFIHAGDRSDRIDGTAIVDGVARASAVRPRGEPALLVRDLAYDAQILPRPRIWQKPWFWIAVSGAALAVAGVIVYATYQPDITTRIAW